MSLTEESLTDKLKQSVEKLSEGCINIDLDVDYTKPSIPTAPIILPEGTEVTAYVHEVSDKTLQRHERTGEPISGSLMVVFIAIPIDLDEKVKVYQFFDIRSTSGRFWIWIEFLKALRPKVKSEKNVSFNKALRGKCVKGTIIYERDRVKDLDGNYSDGDYRRDKYGNIQMRLGHKFPSGDLSNLPIFIPLPDSANSVLFNENLEEIK